MMIRTHLYKSVILMASLFISAGIIINSAMADTYDDFQGDIIDSSKWVTDFDTGVSVSQTGGRLELSISPSANGDSFGGEVYSISVFSGDFDIQVDFSLVSWPSENGVRSALYIYSMSEGDLGIERSATSPLGYFPERYVMNGPMLKGSFPTSDQNGTLRLHRVGNLITGYALDAVLGWQTIASYTNEELGIFNSDLLRLSLNIWSHDDPPFFNPGGQSVTVAFDNVLLTADDVRSLPPNNGTTIINLLLLDD